MTSCTLQKSKMLSSNTKIKQTAKLKYEHGWTLIRTHLWRQNKFLNRSPAGCFNNAKHVTVLNVLTG